MREQISRFYFQTELCEILTELSYITIKCLPLEKRNAMDNLDDLFNLR